MKRLVPIYSSEVEKLIHELEKIKGEAIMEYKKENRDWRYVRVSTNSWGTILPIVEQCEEEMQRVLSLSVPVSYKTI